MHIHVRDKGRKLITLISIIQSLEWVIISFINSYFKGHFCTSMKLFAHANSLFETDTRSRRNLFLPDFFLFLFAVFNKTPLPYETCYTLVIYMLIKRSYFVVSQSFFVSAIKYSWIQKTDNSRFHFLLRYFTIHINFVCWRNYLIL